MTKNIKTSVQRTDIQSKIGKLYALFSDINLLVLSFTNDKTMVKHTEMPHDDIRAKKLNKQISEYFSGKRKRFNIHFLPKGTKFQKTVWEELLNIPYGETISYSQLAIQINKPKAVRAVAGAARANPLPIIIPCHRLIGKDGSLRGFAGGIERKRMLLETEMRFAANFR